VFKLLKDLLKLLVKVKIETKSTDYPQLSLIAQLSYLLIS